MDEAEQKRKKIEQNIARRFGVDIAALGSFIEASRKNTPATMRMTNCDCDHSLPLLGTLIALQQTIGALTDIAYADRITQEAERVFRRNKSRSDGQKGSDGGVPVLPKG